MSDTTTMPDDAQARLRDGVARTTRPTTPHDSAQARVDEHEQEVTGELYAAGLSDEARKLSRALAALRGAEREWYTATDRKRLTNDGPLYYLDEAGRRRVVERDRDAAEGKLTAATVELRSAPEVLESLLERVLTPKPAAYSNDRQLARDSVRELLGSVPEGRMPEAVADLVRRFGPSSPVVAELLSADWGVPWVTNRSTSPGTGERALELARRVIGERGSSAQRAAWRLLYDSPPWLVGGSGPNKRIRGLVNSAVMVATPANWSAADGL